LSAADQPDPQEHPDLAVVRALLAAYAARDLEAALPLLTEDVVMRLETTGRMAGRHEPYVGHDGVRDYFGDMTRVWDEVELIPASWDVEDDRVVVRGRAWARIGQQELHAQAKWEYTLRDGRIAAICQTLTPDA
jgi:ketosteroid isomerase-like protein